MVARDYLTDFELMLMLAILRVGDEAYGVPVAREIEALGERTVMLGAVYTGLDRLEANGLVSSTLGPPTPERGGRAKRYFRVTPTGMKAVRRTRRAFTRLWTGIPELEGGHS
ncbi:MAG: PadR family transcriptional regulator [Acidobacteria bacterium]|nr:MAG: PadR family transcriptional regulator [Acidobacteriota bacterium]